MKSLLLLCALLALCGGLLFVPVGGRTLWARADLPRSAARLAARGLRAGWDYVAALGHRPATPAVPAHSPPPAAAKKNNFFSSRAGRGGILPQPPKEKLEKSDRAALDKLVAHGR
jgi:hypothetical protein